MGAIINHFSLFQIAGIVGEAVLASEFWDHQHGHVWGVGSDVLILFSDLPLHNPEVVPRRSSELTKEDKLKLQSLGLPDCQDELAIIEAQIKLQENLKVVGVKSGKLSRGEVIECIRHLLTETKKDGGTHRIKSI